MYIGKSIGSRHIGSRHIGSRHIGMHRHTTRILHIKSFTSIVNCDCTCMKLLQAYMFISKANVYIFSGSVHICMCYIGMDFDQAIDSAENDVCCISIVKNPEKLMHALILKKVFLFGLYLSILRTTQVEIYQCYNFIIFRNFFDIIP